MWCCVVQQTAMLTGLHGVRSHARCPTCLDSVAMPIISVVAWLLRCLWVVKGVPLQHDGGTPVTARSLEPQVMSVA